MVIKIVYSLFSDSKYVNNLIVPQQQHEDNFAYIIRKQKLYSVSIWLYTSCGDCLKLNCKVKLFKTAIDSDKDRWDVTVLVWEI